MKQVVCDFCGEVLPGEGFAHYRVDHVVFDMPGDFCFFCACEKAYEAASKWKAEADASVDDQRRACAKGEVKP